MFAALALTVRGKEHDAGWTVTDGFANVLDRCLAVREGEQVVLLTDEGTDAAVVAGVGRGDRGIVEACPWSRRCRSPRCPAPSRRTPWRP